MLKDFFKKISLKNWLLIAGIAVLLITNGITIYFLLLNKGYFADKKGTIREPVALNTNQFNDYTKELPKKEEEKKEEEKPEPIMPEKDLTKGEITVEWNDWLIKEDSGTFDYEYLKKQLGQNLYTQFADRFTFYKAGKIIDGPYTGKDFYIIEFLAEGMSQNSGIFRVIKDDNEKNKYHTDYESKFIVLTNHSTSIDEGSEEELVFTKNENITVADLEPPNEIQIPNSTIKFVKEDKEPFSLISNYDNPTPLFKYNDNDFVYKANVREAECFIVKAKDFTARKYFFDLKFATLSKNIPEMYSYYPNFKPVLIDAAWLDGTKNNNEYISIGMSSCGLSQCYKYANYIDIGDLVETGKTNTGDALYELKDKNFKETQDAKFPLLESIYEYYYPGYNGNKPNEKIPFEEFLKEHPIIYWQDPFGSFLEFKNANYLPSVECGKPVIYLYPEQEIDVSVKVYPNGGFSFTEPEYHNGWFVKASPNGDLYNYNNNTPYPYLFWEGRGINYKQPEKGFVAAKNEVEKVLWDKLALLGLNEKESSEFIDFWLPKMQEADYYFITFLPQNEFDKIAPLDISPKPDTVIRIFMDYQALDEYKEVEAPELSTPQRNGFTVVEWGGALHK